MKNEEFNLFSQPVSKKKATPSSKKAASEKIEPIPEELLSRYKDTDSMLKRMHEIRSEIQTKLESAYQKSGVTPRMLDNYIESLPEKNNVVEGRLAELEDKAYSATGIKPKIKGTKKVVKATKSRQSKTLGSRKRWLPMK